MKQKNADKAMRERLIFHRFIKGASIPIDINSIESRDPPEPDIYCTSLSDGPYFFELVELCSEEIAEDISRTIKNNLGVGRFLRLTDPTQDTLKKKFRKKYNTNLPVKLLCYTDGYIISPDDLIEENIIATINGYDGDIKFCEIWFHGERITKKIF